jgi:hypothetical protein
MTETGAGGGGVGSGGGGILGARHMILYGLSLDLR